jgi:predicted amidohydrolase
MTQLRAGLVQLRTPADQAAALAQAGPLARKAAEQGAQLILTPEASNILQRDRQALMTAVRPLEEDECVQGLLAIARELKVWMLIGSALVKRPDGQLANRAVLANDTGEVVATYDKIHMFDVDLPTGERHRESALYAPGEQAAVAETPWGRVIGKLDHDDPDVLVCDLDLAEVAQARGAIPALVNERAFAGP